MNNKTAIKSQVVGTIIGLLIGSILLFFTLPRYNPRAVETLENFNFTEIETEGSRFSGCGVFEPYKTYFEAKNSKNKFVFGMVCGNIWGANTVRTY